MRLALNAVFLSLSLMTLATTKYPMAVFERPLTMPKNSFESALLFSDDHMMMLGADYGITDYTQIGLAWDGFETAESAPVQKISLIGAQFLFATDYVCSMAVVAMPLHFNDSVFREVSVSLPTYIPILREKFNIVLFENIVKLHWREEAQADFKFETRFVWQATHSLCLSLVTDWGTVNTSGAHKHIAQATPLIFEALYAITPMLDIVGVLGYDNIQSFESTKGLTGMLGIVFRGGDIEG
ncbi:MAG: hypothetical protein WCK49_11050 [Myxococcaceae bacterium]